MMRKVQLFRSKDDRKTDNNKISMNPSIVKAAEAIQNNIFQKSVMIDDFELFIPPSLKRFQPLSPYNFEEQLYQGLKMVLKPAMIVFEAGSYCGVLTSLIDKMVGDEGQVHLFEASFDSIERARQMVFHNHLKNVQFMNVFLAAESGSEQDFYVIRSSDGWAVSSADAGILLLYPEAQNIKVSALSLDDYCRENDVIPDVIKMDIEGAEYAALSGANHILSHYAPDIILEVHGDRMPGISGNTAMLMRLLSDDGYRFFDLESGTLMTAGQYSQEYPIYGHVLCSVKDMTTHQFLQRSDVFRNQRIQREILLDQRKKARELVDQGQFRQALEILKELCETIPEDADLYYLTAFSHHHLGENFPQVLKDYQKAFELGFDEFWIRYNRANLFYQMKDLDSALNELEIAIKLYPEHEGARSLWQILSKKA
ncbi:FkbM family methyltransferase [bacterium]|nr:MAG: FkbM family methyltransferase [bacterium]